MRKTLRKPEWIRVLVVVLGAGLLWGSATVIFAESAPSPSAVVPATKLVGEQAIVFQGGYLQAAPEPIAATVIAARETKSLFSYGDIGFLKIKPTVDVKVGDQLTIFRPVKQVYHPLTRKYLGQMIRILGVVEITRAADDGVAEVRVVQSFDALTRGDHLKMFEVPPPVPTQQVTNDPLTGVIVDFKEQRQIIASLDVLYIDKGELDGVALGDRFSVIRPGRRQSATAKTLDLTVGEVKVVGLQAHTATAYVMKSAEGLERGDIVNRLPAPPPKTEPAPTEVAKAVPSEPAPTRPVRKELEDVYFEFDKWDLTEQTKNILTAHVDILKQNPTAALTIEGHADERGSHEYNRALGEKRAQEVRRFLAELGVSNTVKVVSYGKERPLCTEPTEACHAKNRRTHLALVGN
ncbi:MAG TPA: OmpA family protein [Nitrospirales bacterium]|nr:OmpA family protein [Nitrospirales bacterium]